MDTHIKTESTKENVLSFDIRRTLILGAYIKEWAIPEYRVILQNQEKNIYIEIYYFPPYNENYPARFATVGLSNTSRTTGEYLRTEWMLALENKLGDESIDRIFSYFCDLITHNIEHIDSSVPPRVMSESHLAPEKWKTKAILIDELRGESEHLETLKIGNEEVSVLWVVPISKQESKMILEKGIDAFDDYIEQLSYSIIDPKRPD